MKGQSYFKRVLLLLCLIFSTASFSKAQQLSVTCPVFQQNYATGSCNATTKTQNSTIYTMSAGGERGWAKFDISGIPDSVTINTVKVHFFISGLDYPFYYITKLAADPVTTSAPNIWALIGSANSGTSPNTYLQYTGTSNTGWAVQTLNNYGKNDLVAALQQGWFALGFYEYETTGIYYFYSHGWNDAYEPYLEIIYTPQFLNNDIALNEITLPTGDYCDDTVPIQVVIGNSGTNVINTCLISVFSYSALLLTYNYTSPAGIPPGGTDTVDLGNLYFAPGYHQLSIYASNPNGQTDPYTLNNNHTHYFSVFDPPTISLQPQNQTVYVGGATQFTLSTPIYYYHTFQWQVSTDNGLTFTDLSNGGHYNYVDSSQLFINSAQLSMNGYLFRCRIETTCGIVISNNALLTVNNGNLTLTQIYADPDTICYNSTSGTHVHAIVNGGSGTYTYNWTSVPAGFSSTLASPIVNPTQTTHYLCTVSDGLNTVSGDCWVHVNYPPNPALAIVGPTSVCKGQNALIYTVPPIQGALYYYWTVPAGFIFTSNSNTITVNVGNNATSGNITVRGYNYCGTGAISTLPVTVNPSPIANAGPDQTIVAGATANLTATASGGTLPYSFHWSNGTNGSSIFVTPTATTTYSVTVTDGNGCTGIDYVVVNVNANVNLVTHIPSSTRCSGLVSIPIMVTNFYGVASISLRLFYDTTQLNYTGFAGVNSNLSSGTMLVNASGGAIQIAWFSITPANIGTAALLYLQFQADTGYSVFTWDLATQGACQYTNINNNTIPAVFYGGSLTIHACSNVEGHVWYNNNTHTPMTNTPVKLLQNGVTMYQTTTDTAGHYFFSNLANGTYESTVQPTKPWGGVNAADALQILKHFVNMITLSGLAYQASDVDLSNSINSVDALMVAKRFVNMITSFPAPDWRYDGTTFTMNGTSNVYDSIMVLCSGDADRSYIPPYAKMAPSVRISQLNSIVSEADQTIEIPVYTDNNAEIGSISLVMDFNSDYLTLLDIKAVKDGYQVFNLDGKQVRYAWFSIDPMQVNAGDELLHLICKIEKTNGKLEINADNTFEITDIQGIVIPDMELKYSKPVMNENTNFLGQNTPNPFDNFTDIPYYLSENANVQLSVYDYTGKLVKQLIDKQEDKGNHSIKLYRNDLAPGIYICRMTVRNSLNLTNYNKRIIIK